MADKELSAEDLREKLFHTFTNRGVLDSLKSQLRNCLVTELQQSAKINLANGRKKPPEELSLFHQAANSLVVNHLKRCNFEYTLSVFLPESGTPKDKLLTIKDVLLILKIDPDSSLYRSLESSISSKDSTKSFLWEFICQMSKHFCHSKETVAIQTEETSSIWASSIDEKLRFVDKAFSERAEKESEAWSTQAEQKIANFQRQCEEQKRHELDAEIQRYKTTELARMRLEEREKCQKEIKMAKDQSEKDYSLKSEVLRVKEKEIMERLHRQQQIQEEEAYAQRQKMLEEMRMIRERENDFKRRQELDIKSNKNLFVVSAPVRRRGVRQSLPGARTNQSPPQMVCQGEEEDMESVQVRPRRRAPPPQSNSFEGDDIGDMGFDNQAPVVRRRVPPAAKPSDDSLVVTAVRRRTPAPDGQVRPRGSGLPSPQHGGLPAPTRRGTPPRVRVSEDTEVRRRSLPQVPSVRASLPPPSSYSDHTIQPRGSGPNTPPMARVRSTSPAGRLGTKADLPVVPRGSKLAAPRRIPVPASTYYNGEDTWQEGCY